MKNQKKEPYLVKSSSQRPVLVNNVIELLDSSQTDNISLAFEILKGGGVPSELVSHLFAIEKWHPSPGIRSKAKKLFRQAASTSLKKFIRENWKSDFETEYNESRIAQILHNLSRHPELDKTIIGLTCLKLSRKGGKFCLEESLSTDEQILKELIQGKELHLANFGLMRLPQEVGHFPELKILNISGNLFEDIPPEIAKLHNLQSLYYARTPLTALSVQFLEKTFPKIFSFKYYNEGIDLKAEESYLQASFLFLKALSLQADFAQAWYQLGACYVFAAKEDLGKTALLKAKKAYQKELAQYPQMAIYWFDKSCIHSLLGEKAAALSALRKSISLNNDFKRKAIHEEALYALRTNGEFQELSS